MSVSSVHKRRLVDFPILESGTVYWAAWSDSSVILLNGSPVVSNASEGSTGSFAVTQGDIVRTFMNVGMHWGNVGMEVLPSHWSYRRTGVYLTRYTPHEFYIWAKQGGTVEMRIGDYTKGTPDASLVLSSGQVGLLTDSSTGWFFFDSADTNFLVWRDGGSGDHVPLRNPSNEIFIRSPNSVHVWGTGGYSAVGNGYYRSNDRREVLAGVQIGDGSGGDAEMSAAFREWGDTYIFDHAATDWWVGTIAPNTITISNWNGSSWVQYTSYDLTAASRSNPLSASEGAASGAGAVILTGPVKFEGTERFYLRTNVSTDEYTVRGFIRPTGTHKTVKGGTG